MIFPLGFFEKFKENAKEKTNPSEKPQFPLSAFEQHKERTKDKFITDILKISEEPYGLNNKYKPQDK